MSKTKAFVRTKVWFPGIDKSIETMIRECLPCQATTPEEHRESLNMSELPDLRAMATHKHGLLRAIADGRIAPGSPVA